jgi:Fic family protein
MEPVKKAFLLKEELATLPPLPQELEAKIMQKFRIDWNYHSNRLEGNALSYEETTALLLFGLTAEGKPLRDHVAMQSHQQAVARVQAWAREGAMLTEPMVRELHTLLYAANDTSHRPGNPDGPAGQEFGPGQYKTQPRHGNTVTGDRFDFTAPKDTPTQMDDLLGWYREKATSRHLNPVSVAAEMHYRFTRIHPFAAGNGPMARLLMNFVLLRFGFPPVIIEADDRMNYLSALQQADSGLIEMFVTYIAERLNASLERLIRAARGEQVFGPDAFDQQLARLEKRLTHAQDAEKTAEQVHTLFTESILPLFRSFAAGSQKFTRFYEQLRVRFACDDFEADSVAMAERTFPERIGPDTGQLGVMAHFQSFSHSREESFDYQSRVVVKLMSDKIQFVDGLGDLLLEKSYGESLTKAEIEKVVAAELYRHLGFIERSTQG